MMNCDENGIPRIGSPWVHKKNKISYTVYDITNAEADPGRNEEYPITVSYIGMNGKKWSKSLANFLDRMEPSPDAWGFVPILQVPSALSAEAWKRAFAQGEDAGNMHERVAAQIVEHEDFRALLFTHTNSSAVLCCVPTARDLELLNSGEYTPEELWGGSRPTCPACINADKPAKTKTPWVPYLVDRADGVAGHYAIGRWNPAGYQEVWNLWRHCWGSASEDVLTYDEAMVLMKSITVQERTLKSKGPWETRRDNLRGCTKHVATLDTHPIQKIVEVQSAPSSQIEFPPLKINVTTDATLKPKVGLWYCINANDIFIDQASEAIRSILMEVGGTLAGAKTDKALDRFKFDWKQPRSAAWRDTVALNGMNYVGQVPMCGPVVWGNRTVRGGVLPDLIVVVSVLREVSKYVRDYSDKGSPFDLSFWFSLQQRASEVMHHFVTHRMVTPPVERFFQADAQNCVLHLKFPMSAINGAQDRSFDVGVFMERGDLRIDVDEAIAEAIDEVVSLDWILMG